MEDKLEPNKDELIFPIMGATSCPHCKSTKKVGQMAFDALVKAKKIPASPDWGLKQATPIQSGTASVIDPTPIWLLMGLEFEICGNCFAMYATKVEPKAVPLPSPGSQNIFKAR